LPLLLSHGMQSQEQSPPVLTPTTAQHPLRYLVGVVLEEEEQRAGVEDGRSCPGSDGTPDRRRGVARWPCDTAPAKAICIDAEANFIGDGISGRPWKHGRAR
jgi:hypothetical protein